MRLAALLVAAMSAQSALADDRPQNASDWSGAYVGAYGGLGVSSGRAALKDFSGTLLPLDVQYGLFPQGIKKNSSGGAIGIGAGFNFQSGTFVSGVEADFGYVGTSPELRFDRIDNVPSSPFPGVTTSTRYSTDFGALGTLRARAGYAFGNTVIFGTAGLAIGRVYNRFELSLVEVGYTSPNWSGSGTRAGYTVGFGIEHRITNAISLKFDSLYVDLADRTILGADPAAFPNESISYRFTNQLIVTRLGINMRF